MIDGKRRLSNPVDDARNISKEEIKKYLSEMCNRINNRHGIIAILKLDDYVTSFLDSEHAEWIRKKYNSGTVYIPRFDAKYEIVTISEGFRGYKPKMVIIDSRLSFDVLQCIIEPCLICCAQCNYF